MKKVGNIRYLILGMLISGIMFGTGTYAGTVISSNDISYVDNANLGVNNVQAAIDGTCTKFSSQLANLKSEVKKETIDELYPVGSIYMSTTISTASNVATTLGVGIWERYAQGRTLIGEGSTTDTNKINLNYKIGNSGGSSISSISHTHTVSSHSHTYSWSGSHQHELPIFRNPGKLYFPWNVYGHIINTSFLSDGAVVDYSSGTFQSNSSPIQTTVRYNSGSSTINVSGSTSSNGAQTISYNGNISIVQPYVVVYMYRRIS